MKAPDSFLLRTIVRFLFFLINIFAAYLLLRGHNLPGGGFIAGLATAISFLLLELGIGTEALHRIMRFDPVRIAAAGLLLASVTGAAPLMAGRPFLEHFSVHLTLPIVGEIHTGTALLFDIGVYLVVVGVTCKAVFAFSKSTEGLHTLVGEEAAIYSSVRESPIEEIPPRPSPAAEQHYERDSDAN